MTSVARRIRGAAALLSALVTVGCGARTGLDVPPPGDAGVDAVFFDAGPVVLSPEIFVVVTADNSYRFGFGDSVALRDAPGAAEAFSACQIFCCSQPCTRDADCAMGTCGPLGACEDDDGPEVYRIAAGRATSRDFLYVVAWSDDSVTQGVLAEIRTDARVVRSGDPGWTVCATGQDFDTGSGGPSDAQLTDWLARCARGESPSGGWVGVTRSGAGLAVGEPNLGAEGDFPETCPVVGMGDRIGPEARWMWFDRESSDPSDAFVAPQPEFLIFRLPTTALTGP